METKGLSAGARESTGLGWSKQHAGSHSKTVQRKAHAPFPTTQVFLRKEKGKSELKTLPRLGYRFLPVM